MAAGKGSRINQLSENTNKCLLKIKGKSIIEYNLDSISNLNISEIIIVVGYKKDRIIKKYGSKYNKIKIRYVEQNKQKGLVNAIKECESWVNDNFFLLLGDEFFYKPDHKGMLYKFKELKMSMFDVLAKKAK